MTPPTIHLPRLLADCGRISVTGTHDGARWSISLRGAGGEHLPLHMLGEGERRRVVEMLERERGHG